MTFLAPWVLLGTLAAGIPVALHFFFRARYRKVPWAAMKFLRTSIEQTSRRLKFQELVLMILRTLALLLLAFALARPSSAPGSGAAGSGRGEAVDAIFLLDTSYSMAARDGELSRLERAKAGIRSMIEQLPTRSTAQIVAVADRATLLGPRVPANLEAARQLLDEVQVSHLSTDFLPAITEAIALLERGTSPYKEVYLFSDMQRLGWDRQPAALKTKFEELKRQAGVYFVRCGTRVPKSAAVVELRPQAGIPHTANRTAFAVLVRNTGTEEIRDLTATLEIDGKPLDKDAQPIPRLAPGETRAVTLTGKVDKPGLRVVTARLSADELEVDNRLDRVVHFREQVRILVVDGKPDSKDPEKANSFFLTHALVPMAEDARVRSPLLPIVVPTTGATPAALADKDLCILCDVGLDSLSQDFLDRLSAFVKDGHGLIIGGGPQVATYAQRYNDLLGPGKLGLLPLQYDKLVKAPREEPWRPDPASASTGSFLAKFREPPLDTIGKVEIAQALTLVAPKDKDGARVLLRMNTSQPLLAARTVGTGEVLQLAISVAPDQSDWPNARPSFVPFIQEAVAQLVQRSTSQLNRVAGEPLTFPPPADAPTGGYVLIKPDGTRTPLHRPRDARPDDPYTISGNDTPRAGVYRLEAQVKDKPTEAAAYAVVPDLRESENLEALTEGQIDDRIGFAGVHAVVGGSPEGLSIGERLHREWTMYVLVALLLIAIGETVWAWLCGRAW